MRFTSIAILSYSLIAAANETPSTKATGQIETATTASSSPSSSSSLDSLPNDATSPQPTTAPEAEEQQQDEEELKKRQAPGQVVGAGVPNSPDPTQMSPVMTYMKYGPDGKQTPMVYTQTFAAVPDQWPAPKSGAIGLGTIAGQIGVVKTKAKRNYIAEATAAVKRGVHGLEKRKKKGSSGGGGNAASGVAVPMLTVAAALVTGVLAVFL